MQQNLFTPYLLPTFEVPINLINLEDYYRPIREQLEELQAKYDDLKTENEELHKTLDKLKKKSKKNVPSKKKRRRKRRSLDHIEKSFKCPFQECSRQYASDLAMNLHIKNKHNGGTKTVREHLAKQIVLAQEKGVPIPQVDINFPPGYLQDFKKKYFNEA